MVFTVRASLSVFLGSLEFRIGLFLRIDIQVVQ